MHKNEMKLAYFCRCIYPLIWHILRYWLTFFVPVFYKKIGINHVERLTVKGPVIIAMNHPNAFADSFILNYLVFPVKLKYLARGDVFKPGLISVLLDIIGIVPIFRIQDAGKEGLKKNDETYKRVNFFLKRNAKLIIFAEGTCVQERRLRPLKKGVARMAFGAYETIENENLMVIPVGVNYNLPHKFRSNIFYNVGEPILVKDFIEDYKKNPAKTSTQFLQSLDIKMKALITNIDDKQNDEAVLMIETLCKKDWILKEKLNINNLEHDFLITQKITDLINKTGSTHQAKLDAFSASAKTYFDQLEKNKLRDWLINPNQNKNIHYFNLSFRILILIFFLPIFILSLVGNFLPLYLSHTTTKKLIKRKEFYASVAIVMGMVFFLLNYIVIYFVANYFISNAIYSFALCALFIISGWFALFYHPFLFKTIGMFRILSTSELATSLKKQREALITLINNF